MGNDKPVYQLKVITIPLIRVSFEQHHCRNSLHRAARSLKENHKREAAHKRVYEVHIFEVFSINIYHKDCPVKSSYLNAPTPSLCDQENSFEIPGVQNIQGKITVLH